MSASRRRTRAWRVFLTNLVTLAVLAPAAAVLSHTSPSAAVPPGDWEPRSMRIVLIGDSYSAGNGARDASGDRDYFGPKGCYRSHSNWAEKYVAALRDAGYNITFINRACSGAVSDNLLTERKMGSDILSGPIDGVYSDPNDPAVLAKIQAAQPCKPTDEEYFKYNIQSVREYINNQTMVTFTCDRYLPPQTDAIDLGTDLVLFTDGGNDIGFSDIVQQCFAVGFRDPGDCRNHINSAISALPQVQDRLGQVFNRMRDRGLRNDAKVVLLSYPYLSLDNDYTLKHYDGDGLVNDQYNAADAVRNLGDLGDQKEQAAVDLANVGHAGQVTFLNTVKGHFAGHEPDGRADNRNPDRWLHEMDTKIPIEWYHPNEYGHPELAWLLEQNGSFNAGSAPATGGDIDIVFAVDTTGSMGGTIDTVKQDIQQIVDNVTAQTSSARFALVDYRDFPSRTGTPEDYASKLDQAFTSDSLTIKNAVNALSLGDGGDYPETVYSGIMTSLEQPWRAGVKKVVLVLGDAPPLDPEPVTGYTAQTVIDKALAVDPASVYVVDNGGLATTAVQQIVDGTEGEIVDASTSTDVPGAITTALDSALAKPYAWAAGPYLTRVGKQVLLDASGSYATSGSIVSYEWDLDGDGVYDRTVATSTTTYAWPAAFDGTISLRVTDSAGRVALATVHAAATPDGDEVAQAVDNCPTENNPGQVDYDADGVGDECDATAGYPTTDKPGVVEGSADTTAPTITVQNPVASSVYGVGQYVVAQYSCADEAGGSGVASCTGSTPNGIALSTTTQGSFALTVTATDVAGNRRTVSVPYQVRLGAPVITFLSPDAQLVGSGLRVTISGYNFTSGATVKFGTKSGSQVTVVGPNKITVTAPSSTKVTSMQVTVTTSLGTSNATTYSYVVSDSDPHPCDPTPGHPCP